MGLLCMIKRKEVSRLEIPGGDGKNTYMYSVEKAGMGYIQRRVSVITSTKSRVT
jgi:hypothetical protein